MRVRSEYKELVKKIICDPDLKEIVYNLLQEVILDEERRRAEYYTDNGVEAPRRDLLNKLMYDLELYEVNLKAKLKQAETIGGKDNV